MISRSSPPAVGTIQMCGVFVLASRLTSTTLKITHLPSGEITGSPTRLSFIMSSKVKGCLACANTGGVKAMRAKKAKKKGRMRYLLGKRMSVAGKSSELLASWGVPGSASRHDRLVGYAVDCGPGVSQAQVH